MDRLVSDTEGIAKPESSPRMDGNVLSMMFGAKTGGGS
ncbi:putative translation initiation factor IF-3 [Anaplasma phagocytophilum str. CRT53-1]|uniref:Putative translation initiation factor IF-3 n=1 Tax=Anaplasma phagocytophilum str. CRT53-1 TaxID=1359157 RepID=A0A0F3PLB6_ANAPH|nr:putative translation initiation factor IF-3 [Anaplasma phagocytophilum str. CRT53-1]